MKHLHDTTEQEDVIEDLLSLSIDPKENPQTDPKENPETDPKKKPEVEPEHLPKEDPGQSDPDEDDDDDDPFKEIEIGDDPDEIGKKTTIF